MTPRAHRALTHKYNTIDMERRSPSYEVRLTKYAERGFSVLVPSLDRSKIDPQVRILNLQLWREIIEK